MCGILGIVSSDHPPPAKKTVREALDLMTARGPDDWGLEQFGNVSIGARRLKVLDLSAADIVGVAAFFGRDKIA